MSISNRIEAWLSTLACSAALSVRHFDCSRSVRICSSFRMSLPSLRSMDTESEPVLIADSTLPWASRKLALVTSGTSDMVWSVGGALLRRARFCGAAPSACSADCGDSFFFLEDPETALQDV